MVTVELGGCDVIAIVVYSATLGSPILETSSGLFLSETIDSVLETGGISQLSKENTFALFSVFPPASF